jgi:hypothetical protein
MKQSELIALLNNQVELQNEFISSLKKELTKVNDDFFYYKEKYRLQNDGIWSLNNHSLQHFRDRFYQNTMYGKFITSEYAERVFNAFIKERRINN